MSWMMAFKAADYPHGTFVVGEKHTVFGHEHTILAVTDHPVKYYVRFDGECHRDDGKPLDRFVASVPPNVDELKPVTLDARTLEALARAIPSQ